MKKDNGREKIQKLFLAADAAKAAHVDAEARTEKLDAKARELDAALPALQAGLRAAEGTWRLALGRESAAEGSADAVAAAEAGVAAAHRAIDVNRATLAGVEDILFPARNESPLLAIRAESALRAAWQGVSDRLVPEVRAAAEVIQRFYISESNSLSGGVPAEMFYRKIVPINFSPAIAAELEKEYRT